MRATTCGQWYEKSRAGDRIGPHIEDGSSVRNLVGLAQRSKLLAAMDPTVVQIKSQNRELASGEPSFGDTLFRYLQAGEVETICRWKAARGCKSSHGIFASEGARSPHPIGSFVGCTSLGRRQCSRGAVCVKALPQGSATTPRRTLSGLDIRPLQRRLSGSDYPGMAARDEAGVTAAALQYSGEWSLLVLFVCVGGCSAKISWAQRCFFAFTCRMISSYCSASSHSPRDMGKVRWSGKLAGQLSASATAFRS